MAERTLASEHERGLVRDAAAIVLLGVALSLVYNWRGLESRPGWGLPWIGTDRVAELPRLAAGPPPSDDPMALPEAGAGLPVIPELDRPVQAELDAVKRLFDADAALIVDAREPAEFAEAHIAGAINLPYDEVSAEPDRLAALDTGGRPIVVYCGGGECELSMDLAYELIYAGHSRVLVYMGGFPEWEAAGYPVESR
jgi:rhodanese-related sulfurtransferase